MPCSISCQVESTKPVQLPVNWLDALIYETATRKMLFGDFQVRLAEEALCAKARGEPMDAEKHELAIELKRRNLHRAGSETSCNGQLDRTVRRRRAGKIYGAFTTSEKSGKRMVD